MTLEQVKFEHWNLNFQYSCLLRFFPLSGHFTYVSCNGILIVFFIFSLLSISMAPPRGIDAENMSPWWNEVDLVSRYDSARGGGARKWKCHFCGSIKSGGMDRVRAHLLGIRGKGISVCPTVSRADIIQLQALADRLDAVGSRLSVLDP